ncbi:MAG TPA: hypothetical protein PKN75_15240 [Bacteroidia bacterium]|nr:hypothetical protein [Bacteroidia bacterium]
MLTPVAGQPINRTILAGASARSSFVTLGDNFATRHPCRQFFSCWVLLRLNPAGNFVNLPGGGLHALF